jgi:hypothetical protein
MTGPECDYCGADLDEEGADCDSCGVSDPYNGTSDGTDDQDVSEADAGVLCEVCDASMTGTECPECGWVDGDQL